MNSSDSPYHFQFIVSRTRSAPTANPDLPSDGRVNPGGEKTVAHEVKPDEAGAPQQDDPTTRPLTDFWSTLTKHADAATRQMFQQIQSSANAEQWRRRWLNAVSESLDAYMRSPAFLQAMAAANQQIATAESFQTWQRFLKLPDVAQVARSTVATTPYQVVYEEGTLRLLRYENQHGIQFAEPVLICFALVNRPYILDLQAERSVIRQLLRRGFDVYLIDWGVPTAADHALRLSDYICRLMKNAADAVCGHSGTTQFNLLGYCMGGTMSAMFTSLYAQLVRNLIVLATPIDFGGDESLLNVWAKKNNFDVDALIDAYGNCPGPFLQASFQMMRPIQSFHEKFIGFVEKMHEKGFLENFFAMEQWVSDSIPVAGETFREFVKMLYQQNKLVKGEMRLNDTRIDLREIKCPLLMLTAALDHLVTPASTLALRDHVASADVEHMSIEAGHIGLAVSSKAHAKLWPAVADWIARHSTAKLDRHAPG